MKYAQLLGAALLFSTVACSQTKQVEGAFATLHLAENNILYRGIETRVEFSICPVPNGKLVLDSNHGTVRYSGGSHFFTPGKNTIALLHLSSAHNGDTVLLASKEFKVKEFPPPFVAIAGKTDQDRQIRLRELLAAQGLAARDNSYLDTYCSVTNFRIGIAQATDTVRVQCDGNQLNDVAKEAIRNSQVGESIIIDEIRTDCGGKEVFPRAILLAIIE